MNKYRIGKILKFTFFGIAALLLFGWAVMTLWNWLIPDIFNGPKVSFFQALGLFALGKILFGGFGKRGCCGPKNQGLWKERMRKKFEKMSPEEKERFRSKYAKCCGFEETDLKNQTENNHAV